jgi:hypothetical protein
MDLSGYFIALLMTIVLWTGSCTIIYYFRKKYPYVTQTPRRLIISFLTSLLLVIVAEAVIYPVLVYLNICPWEKIGEYFWRDVVINMLPVIVVDLLYETFYFFEKWKKATIEAEALKTQQLRSQLNVLKNQISPHFLFNSLNTLITLINEDSQLATRFTEKLSEVYRYILQNKEKELVDLRTELDFAHSFIFLLKMRFGENLHVVNDVPRLYHHYRVAPLTIQMLIENAVKHNVVSAAHPLTIRIFIEDDDKLVVSNNLQLKNMVKGSTKTGLDNIRRRYLLLGNRHIGVGTYENAFRVALPLIKTDTLQHVTA